MIYHEKTDVKQYNRKTANGLKSFNQLNLGYESIFEKGEEVVILKLSDFNELLNKYELVEDLKKNHEIITSELESLKSNNNDYSNQILELSNQIIELNKKLEKANSELNKEKELKSNIVMKYEGIISEIQNKIFFRLLCNLPKSYKELHATEIKEIELNDK